MKALLIPFLCCCTALAGCSAPPDQPVARWSGGQVRQSDLDRELELMSNDERHYREAQRMPAEKTRTDLIRRVALREIAREKLTDTGLVDDPEHRERARNSARTWWLTRWRDRCYDLPMALPDPDELRARLTPRELPRRSRLSHVFVRAEDPAAIDRASRQLDDWRRGIDSLEAFAELARAHSDSESRHRGGRLGWMQEGWLPPSVEAMLDDLAPGDISPPIAMRGGVHIFYVEAVREAETAPIDRRLARLEAQLRTEALDECRRRRLEEIDIETSAQGEGPWRTITVGDWSVGPETIQAIYDRPGADPAEVELRLIDDERLFQSAILGGVLSTQESLRLDDLEGNVWLNILIDDEIERTVGEPEIGELRDRFDDNPARYRAQRRLEIEALSTTIPAGTDPMAFWDELDRLGRDLSDGHTTFADAAAAVGESATAMRWPMAEIREVAGALGPIVFERIKHASPGEIVGPIQDGPHFWVVAVLAEEPARPLGFDEARPRLSAEILRQRRADAKIRIVNRMLATHDFQFLLNQETGDAAPPAD